MKFAAKCRIALMQRMTLCVLLFCASLTWASGSSAQTTSACSPASGKTGTLYCMPIISTENAFLNPSGGGENFVVQKGFVPVTSSIGTQLSTLPTPTPSSGLNFRYAAGGLVSLDPELGPIFSYAPWSPGRRRLYLAFAYQHFQFDKIDDVSLGKIPLQLTACNDPSSAACGTPYIQTNSHYSINLNEFISYASYGITGWLDVSATIPIVDTRTSITTTCSVCFETLDFATPTTLGFTPNSARGSSSGIGDIVFGLKAKVWRGEKTGLSVGVDVRAPTGDAYNFRGAGTTGVRPYMALGYRSRISPHANLGFLINGDSILASTDGISKKHLPNSLDYTVGADFSATPWLSLSGDFLGRVFIDAGTVAINSSGLALHASTETFHTGAVALGFKSRPVKGLLLSANVLISVGANGLHYQPSPMFGISYTFGAK
jgi:hypothetical protein